MKKNKQKSTKLLIIAIIIALITIVFGVVLLLKNNKNSPINKTDNSPSEEMIEQNYEFTKEDAINLIKPLFHSDNYTFEAELNNDSLYIVTITNTLNSTKYIYYVDPATRTYRIDENTK